MLCDLVGSSGLAESLDPEDLQLVFQAYQEACAKVVDHFGGYIARYIGDGVLAYFGYPVANEDDASRAVHTGLGILNALPQLNAQLQHEVEGMHDHLLRVRVGIHTGLVVTGEMGGGRFRDPMAIVGETPNIAARLQEFASPDSVLISGATAGLITGLFELEPRGTQPLKGISVPVPVYEILSESGSQRRFEAAVESGLTILVGRQKEIGLLTDSWQQAKEGQGQAVLLSGEAGIGKSRLVQELKEQIVRDETEHAQPMVFRCSPYYQNSALYSVIDSLQQILQFQRTDTPQAKLAKLEQALRAYRFPQDDTLPLLAALFSLPPPDGYRLLSLSPQKQKERTLEVLQRWLLEKSDHTATYCMWEDLHWADPSTLELLNLYLTHIPSSRMLALLLYRPDFTPPWDTKPYLKQITLSRLGSPQVEEMARRVTGGRALPAEVIEQVVARTDGVPLFVEELTKMVIASDLVRPVYDHYELNKPLPPLGIPITLQDLLTGRLDRLGPAKEVAQLGATLGREFSYELMQTVSPLDEKTLRERLYRLVETELVVQHGLPPHATYTFKHALIRDAAYQSLLKRKRQAYHRQIGQILERAFPHTVTTHPELVAHHYTQAGQVRQAIPFWLQAGQKATQASANVEAIRHLSTGLELVVSLPDTPERAQLEISLQLTLGAPLIATQGYAATAVGSVYTRARELCQQISEATHLFPTLWGLCAFSAVRAELQQAWELGQQMLHLAQRSQDPALLIVSHLALGGTLLWQGEFPAAHEHLEQGVSLYDPQQHHELAFVYGYDPGIACYSYASLVLWMLGYPDQAQLRVEEALRLAHKFSHPYTLVHTLSWAAVLHQYRRDASAAQECAEPTIALSSEQGFPLWLAMGTALRGWALAEQGQADDSLAQLQRGMETWQATGAAWGQSYYPALVAEVAKKADHQEEGLRLVERTLDALEHSEERIYAAELHRLKGELLLNNEFRMMRMENDERKTQPVSLITHHSVEACFQQAIEIAQRQEAKALELRAAMSLSRLWHGQGKNVQACQLLTPILDWFTEGFDTTDLRAARALLEELR